MGQLLSGFSWSPCFKMSVTSANFQIFGKVPDEKESLIIAAKVGRINGKQFFKRRTVILSFPGAFPVRIELITSPTSFYSTVPNENCCAIG